MYFFTQPTTNKLHNIIEKTALFISQQGTQMEIRIKINQKNNPYFAFMDFNDRLHPYYKHLLRAISSGNYTPKPVVQVEQKVESTDKKGGEQQLEQQTDNVEEQQDDDEEDEDSDGDYELHPLLMGSRTSNTVTTHDQNTTNPSNSLTSSAIVHNGSVSLKCHPQKTIICVLFFSILFCPKQTLHAIFGNFPTFLNYF